MATDADAGRRFLKNILGFSLLPWLTFAISFVSVPIATRVFAPTELGRITMFNAYGVLLASLSYVGLDQAFTRFYHEPPNDRSRQYLLTTCLLPPVLTCLTLSAVVLVFWRPVSILLVGEEVFFIAICLCVFALTTCVVRFINILYRMQNNHKWYTIQGLLIAVSSTTLYLAAGFFSASHRPAILLMSASTALWTIVFTVIQRRNFDPHPTKPEREYVRALASYAAPLIPITLLGWVCANSTQVILRGTMGFASLGTYQAALSLAGALGVVQAGFSAYWVPYVFENYKKTNNHFWMVHRLIASLLVLLILGLILAEDLIMFLLGARYRSAIQFFPFLFLVPLCNVLGETTGMGIPIAKKTYWNTSILVVSSATGILACLALVPQLGLIGAALAAASVGIVNLVLHTIIGGKLFKMIQHYGYVVAAPVLTLTAAFANLWLFDQPGPRSVVVLLLMAVAVGLFRQPLFSAVRLALDIAAGLLKRAHKVEENHGDR